MIEVSLIYKPVEAPSTYAETVARLGTAIRIGVLAAGERLPPERELACQLGISRSTLRQALAHLVETGHLVALRGRTGGTFVSVDPPVSSGAPFKLDGCRPLIAWRMTLELGIVQLAVERATDAEREAICAAAEVELSAEWAAFRREDVRFHLLLAQAAHSPRALEEMTRVQGELSDIYTHLKLNGLEPGPAGEQHRELAEAIRGGDAGAARDAMRRHLATVEGWLEGALSG